MISAQAQLRLRKTALSKLFKDLKDLETKHNTALQSFCTEMCSIFEKSSQDYQVTAFPKKIHRVCRTNLSFQVVKLVGTQGTRISANRETNQLKDAQKVTGKMYASRRNLRSFVLSQSSRKVKQFLILLFSVLILSLIYPPEKVKKFNLQTVTEIITTTEVKSTQK